ncbi:hypothetical protein Bca52824_096790 [Brassica carinata]|uniref:Fe2OG dioxygenase domain-containing protein n=1 Tax=Brassica carinata TaxID=52824 RepID=A0A8X7P0L5_BRACI|nr:hypothetical protein Bca52824_096790 [Brassica carinata]
MNHQNEIMIKKETTDKNGLNTLSDQDNDTKKGLGEKWPEPTVRVQSLAESNLATVPDRYIKPPSERPDQTIIINHQPKTAAINIPVINHGVRPELMEAAREAWRSFFNLPVEAKEVYSNSPSTYEGYGSRLGVEKGAILDWNDYYFLHYLPLVLKDLNKWPLYLSTLEVMDEYGEELVKLGERLARVLSSILGLKEEQLQEAFGGEDGCMYEACPWPLPHSDPGGITILLPDDKVVGLQVRYRDTWITVNSHPHAFVVNLGDQIQILSNSIYKSSEHRVIVNSQKERVSLAFFYNPKSDIPIQPLQQLVTSNNPPLYPPMSFDEYRLFIRTQGPRGKSYVESHISSC